MVEPIDSFPGREINMGSKSYLYFGGTAYLSLQTDPDYINLLIKGIAKYGTCYGASRKSNIKLLIYSKVEKFLATWIGSEDGMVMSSGYLAGQLLASFFNTEDYRLFHTPNSHSALFPSANFDQKSISFGTYKDINKALREYLASPLGRNPVIFLDSIDFSGMNYPNFEGLKSLPIEQCIVVIDDSHGIGVVGETGNGIFSKIAELGPKELITCCSFGKALGLQGGAIFGTKTRVNQLKSTNFFAGASPPAPAHMAAFMDCDSFIAYKLKVLRSNINRFLQQLEYVDQFQYLTNYPVFEYSDGDLTEYLKKNGIFVTDFNYLSNERQTTKRIVLCAHHRHEDIDKLAGLLNRFFAKKL